LQYRVVCYLIGVGIGIGIDIVSSYCWSEVSGKIYIKKHLIEKEWEGNPPFIKGGASSGGF